MSIFHNHFNSSVSYSWHILKPNKSEAWVISLNSVKSIYWLTVVEHLRNKIKCRKLSFSLTSKQVVASGQWHSVLFNIRRHLKSFLRTLSLTKLAHEQNTYAMYLWPIRLQHWKITSFENNLAKNWITSNGWVKSSKIPHWLRVLLCWIQDNYITSHLETYISKIYVLYLTSMKKSHS